jgi:N-acetylglutamate synthase/N-acetylornithine aminotransferase
VEENDTLIEIRDLLGEIRELLRPVADAHQDEYDRRQAEREEQRLTAIRALLSSDKRKKAWRLADGTRNQTTIAKDSGMAKGNMSTFFKSLRKLGAVTDSATPQRTVEV